MLKFSRLGLIGVVCLVGVVLSGWLGVAQTPRATVQLTTSPIHEIRPFEAEATSPQTPVQLTLQALDASGQAITDAQMHLQIVTPAPTPWFTTDFPIVEGTTLLDLEAIAPQGKLQLQQMLPIRGTYQLRVDVTPIAANAFAPMHQTLALAVPENWVKYQNFGILALILGAIGLVGGVIIGSRQPLQAGEIAPQRVRLLLSGMTVVAIVALLYVNVSAEMGQSHSSMAMSHMTAPAPPSDQPSQVQAQGLVVQLLGDPSATVGQLASFQVNVLDRQTRQPVTDVSLQIKTTPLENNWIAFAYQGQPATTGKLAWQQQFFDGAPHHIEVEVAPQPRSKRQFQPFKVAQNIAVEGVAPPLTVRLIVLAYMVGILGCGLLLGLGWQRRQPVKFI